MEGMALARPSQRSTVLDKSTQQIIKTFPVWGVNKCRKEKRTAVFLLFPLLLILPGSFSKILSWSDSLPGGLCRVKCIIPAKAVSHPVLKREPKETHGDEVPTLKPKGAAPVHQLCGP